MNNKLTADLSSGVLSDKHSAFDKFCVNLYDFWKSKKYLLVCFFLPAFLMWFIYIAMEVYPFGDNSVLVLDLNGQYVYFFEQLRKILHGDASILYSFGRALGGEFMGIFAYYLASPFSFIVALFPKDMITEALLLMFLLKCGACGLTFGIYIDATRPRNTKSTIIFSVLYALTAYNVVMQNNTMWIDNVIFLPLITLGIEKLIREKKFKLFVIALSIAVLSNYYIGYMMCIYVAIYFFYFYFAHDKNENNPLRENNHFIKSLGRIAFFSVIMLMICAVILMTAYYSLTFGKTTFSDPDFSFKQRFDFIDMLSKVYIGSYDTVRPEGLPFIYCGMLTIILLPMYFISSHIKSREKIASGILIAVFVLSFNGTTIDIIWHGFQRPNWLNYRYSFMLCFIMILLAYKAFEIITKHNYRTILGICAVLALLLIVMQKMELENLPDLRAVWTSLLFIGIYIIILHYMIKGNFKETASSMILIIVCTESIVAGLLNLVALDEDVVYSSRNSYRNFMDRVQPVVDIVQKDDDSFYRMEKTIHRKTNDNLALGIRGLSNSTSTLNADTIKFLNMLGLSSKSHWAKYLGGTPVLDSLLGIKYVISEKDEDVSDVYKEILTYNDDLTVYENEYVLPIAYACNSNITETQLDSYTSPFERMNYMVADLLGEKEKLNLFKPIPLQDTVTENLSESYSSGHKKYTPSSTTKNSKLTFRLTAEEDGIIYCYFPSEYPREVELTLNGSDFDTYYANETFRILNLGHYNKGEEINLSMKLEKDDLYILSENTFFYTLDDETFKNAMSRLSEGGFQIEEYTEDYFNGTITVPENQNYIFTSIPYDEGWVITLDGEKIEYDEILEAVIGFSAEPGEHTLSMKYSPKAFNYGMVISITGVIIFILVCIIDYLIRKKYPADINTSDFVSVLSENTQNENLSGEIKTDSDNNSETDKN